MSRSLRVFIGEVRSVPTMPTLSDHRAPSCMQPFPQASLTTTLHVCPEDRLPKAESFPSAVTIASSSRGSSVPTFQPGCWVDFPCRVITGRHSLWDIFPRPLSCSSQKSHLMLWLGWGPMCASSTTARRVYIFFYLLQFTTSLKARRKIILIFFLFLFENSIYVFKIHKCILIVSALLLSPRSSLPSIMLEYSWGSPKTIGKHRNLHHDS